jgi:tRNA(His) guanylyltransferase
MNDLGNRMKRNYESRSQTELYRRTPVILRLDGKNFSKFCQRFEKPFSRSFYNVMDNVALYLAQNLQGVAYAETHSDEISLLLIDYNSLNTDATYDYNVQKLCSISASMATAEFCRNILELISEEENWPLFDCRAFNIPREEVSNYFYWRYKDCERNSVSMLGRSHFSHSEMNGKSTGEIKLMLLENGIDWDLLDLRYRYGSHVLKEVMNDGERAKWKVYKNKVNFKESHTNIIENIVNIDRLNTFDEVF